MAPDMVPATAPLPRFDPSLARWCGHTLSARGDTVWAMEAMHLNDGRGLYISDVSGDVQNRWRLEFEERRQRRPEGGGPSATGAATSAGASNAANSPDAAGAGRPRRIHGAGKWRGLHMQRTCRSLVEWGFAEWPDGGDGTTTAAAGATAAAREPHTSTVTVEAALPGGGTFRTVRHAASMVAVRGQGRGGRTPKILLPRLTPAGRLAWMRTRLGLQARETIVLALAWGRFKSAGYFIKSRDMIRENVWMTERGISTAYNILSRAGYIDEGKKTGMILRVRRAGRIEPYGPMLGVIEDMVYGARAGEYVYGDAYDDEINRAYAATVEALAEKGEKKAGAAGDASGGRAGGK